VTSPPSQENFYAAPRLGRIPLVVIPLALWLAYVQPDKLFFGLCTSAFALFITFVPHVAVTADEIRISRIFRLPWDNVRRAKLRRRLGQNYLTVQRKRGIRWSIPLDLDNGRSVAEVLLEKSPPGSPIRDALTTPSGDVAIIRAGTPWMVILLFAAIWLANAAARYWLAAHVLFHSDAPEMALRIAPLPTPIDAPSFELTPVTAYGMTFGVPCTIRKEPTRAKSATYIFCTNGNAIIIDDPDRRIAAPWLGEGEMAPYVRDYLVKAAGTDEPFALMRAWLSLTPKDLRWSTPWANNTIRFLLRVKEILLLGKRDLYELTGMVQGFQFGSLDHEKESIDVILVGPGQAVHQIGFTNCSAHEHLKQADVLASAATLQAAITKER